MNKYKNRKSARVDLSSRKNIKIIESEKKPISDDEIKKFEDQLKLISKQVEEFNTYLIEQEIKVKPKISDEEFESIMKNILKQHKILKSMMKIEKDTD